MEWINNTIPNVKLVDLTVLRIFHKAPESVLQFVRENWVAINSIKKPFANSELYEKPSSSSSSSSSWSEKSDSDSSSLDVSSSLFHSSRIGSSSV